MTEKEYRNVKLNSSSSLKDFSLDRRKYHRKYVLSETIREQANKASDMGRIVETLLMEPDRFDELFFMSSSVKIPGGMLGDFVVKLAQAVGDSKEESLDDDVFSALAKKVYNDVKFKIKFETVLSKLEDPEVHLYYGECLNVYALGKTMVSAQDIENAERIVNSLRNSKNTGSICNLETSSNITVINQMKVIDYEIDGMKLKSMLDKVIVNHKTRTVHIYDLKCTWAVEGFFKEYYLFRRAYIQAYLYYSAILHRSTTDLDCGFYGYKVQYPSFIVCDSINYYAPLIYTLTTEDMDDAYLGFEHKGSYYPGVRQIISDCLWAIEYDEWRMSRSNHENLGFVNIKTIQ